MKHIATIGRALALSAAVALASQGAADLADAATPPEPAAGERLDDGNPFQTGGYIRDLIERAQRALAALGLYGGPVSGRHDAQLAEAIANFQRRSGLPGTAVLDEDLVERLESSADIEQLIERLDAARTRETERAREALLSNPDTRHLLEREADDEIADPARDPSSCFVEPSPRCLLDEAVESAKVIATDGRRDWAYGEILVAQVRAGLTGDAISTVRLISDPRLIIVALRRIAEAEARAGRTEAALDALEVIPEAMERAAGAAAVAGLLSDRGMHDAALAAANRLLLERRHDVPGITRHLAEIVPVLAAGGRRDSADALLVDMVLAAREMTGPSGRNAAYRDIAAAYVSIGESDVALRMLDRVDSASDRNAVLIPAAVRLAAGGQFDAARRLADAVEGERYRAVALAGVAEEMQRRGGAEEALRALADAERLLDAIGLPYARDYAASRIAATYADGGPPGTERARATAESIRDTRLRADTFWRMVLKGHEEFAGPAEESVGAIAGEFDRAWLFIELADRQYAQGARDRGAAFFGRALALARGIETPWARARLLARLSLTLETSKSD